MTVSWISSVWTLQIWEPTGPAGMGHQCIHSLRTHRSRTTRRRTDRQNNRSMPLTRSRNIPALRPLRPKRAPS